MNIWRTGIMGVVVGDSLGNPVQFFERSQIANRQGGLVKGMEAGGVFKTPAGTWTDDSSMTLATLSSIHDMGVVDLQAIMKNIVAWFRDGEFTPFGYSFDVGTSCRNAIVDFEIGQDVYSCGGALERFCDNGSLIRIMPACLYVYKKEMSDEDAIRIIHSICGLTHNQMKAKIACGLYCFIVKSILNGEDGLAARIQTGLDEGFAIYDNNSVYKDDLTSFKRLRDLSIFAALQESEISSSGFVVDSLEAAIWSLIGNDNYKDTLLTAVNLGDDADSVGAITGGLAALYYGYDKIPEEWLSVIQRREWIEQLCETIIE